MKRFLFIAFFLLTIHAFSQQKIVVQIVDRPCSAGIEPAFEAAIPKADLDKAEDLFKQSISQKQFFGLIKKKTTNKKEGQEWVTQKFTLKAVSEEPMVVLFQISEFSTLTYIRFFFQTNNGFLGADHVGSKEELADAKTFVHKYAAGLYRQTVKDEIQSEKKQLAKLKKKHDNLERKNKNVRKNVDSNRLDEVTRKSKSGYVDVQKATDHANAYLKDEKKGQKKIRRNQKKQAKIKAEMKNLQIQIKKLENEMNSIE